MAVVRYQLISGYAVNVLEGRFRWNVIAINTYWHIQNHKAVILHWRDMLTMN